MKRSTLAVALLSLTPLVALSSASPAAAATSTKCNVQTETSKPTPTQTFSLPITESGGHSIGTTSLWQSAAYTQGGVTVRDYCVQTSPNWLAFSGIKSIRTEAELIIGETSHASLCLVTAGVACTVKVSGVAAIDVFGGAIHFRNQTRYSNYFIFGSGD